MSSFIHPSIVLSLTTDTFTNPHEALGGYTLPQVDLGDRTISHNGGDAV
jgi:hypothetical protein